MAALASRGSTGMRRTMALTVAVLAFGLVLNSIGNGLLSWGMRRSSWGVVAAGVALQAAFFASYLFALSRADLSFVLPITAVDYVLTALVAAFALGERPPLLRWVGIGLVVLGVGLVLATGGDGARGSAQLYKGRSVAGQGWECPRRKTPLPNEKRKSPGSPPTREGI